MDPFGVRRRLSAVVDRVLPHGPSQDSVDGSPPAGSGRGGAAEAVRARSELIRKVLAGPRNSQATALLNAAAHDPDGFSGMSALVAAGHDVFGDPEASWSSADLEVLIRARTDAEMARAARVALGERATNVAQVVARAREIGAIDEDVSDEAVVHLALAMSAGVALIAPATPTRPSERDWDGILTRIGVAVAPGDLLMEVGVATTNRWRVRVSIPLRAGASSRLFRSLAALPAHTLYLQVISMEDDERQLEIGIAAPESVTADMIVAAAGAAGHTVRITAGQEGDGTDMLTRILDAATYLVKQPDAAPEIAAHLVTADSYEVVDATAGVDDQPDVLRLQWTTQRHVLLHRTWAPFARNEQLRASALLRLAAAVAKVSGDPVGDGNGWIEEVRGGTVWIRLARPEDVELVADMHERISEQSHYQRYFAHTQWRDIQLRRLSGGHRGATLVVQSRDGQVIGLGNVFPLSEGSSTAEIALLVEDAYQGKGLGRVLLRRMVEVAGMLGFTEVLADVLAGNRGMQHLLETTGLTWSSRTADGVRTMRAPLPAASGRVAP